MKEFYSQSDLERLHPDPQAHLDSLRRLKVLQRVLRDVEPSSLEAIRIVDSMQKMSRSVFGLFEEDLDNLPNQEELDRLINGLKARSVSQIKWDELKKTLNRLAKSKKEGLTPEDRAFLGTFFDQAGGLDQIRGELQLQAQDALNDINQQAKLGKQELKRAYREVRDFAKGAFHLKSLTKIAGKKILVEALKGRKLLQVYSHLSPPILQGRTDAFISFYFQESFKRFRSFIDRLVEAREELYPDFKDGNELSGNLEQLLNVGLNETDIRILQFLCDYQLSWRFRNLVNSAYDEEKPSSEFYADLALMLDVSPESVARALSPDGMLLKARLLKRDATVRSGKDQEDHFSPLHSLSQYFIPYSIMDQVMFRSGKKIEHIVELFGCTRDRDTELTIPTHFQHAATEADIWVALYEEKYGNPENLAKKGQKTHSIAGPAGAGKNMFLRATRAMTAVIHPESKKRLEIVDYFINTPKIFGLRQSYGVVDEEQDQKRLEKDQATARLQLWPTIDFFAHMHNQATWERGHGTLIRLVLDEADKDLFNKDVTGNNAANGIKDLVNRFTEEGMLTPTSAICNALDVDHILRRVGPVFYLTELPIVQREVMLREAMESLDADIDTASLMDLAELYDQTPGEMKVSLEATRDWVTRYEREKGTTPKDDEILETLTFLLGTHARAKLNGTIPVPAYRAAPQEIDPIFWNTGELNLARMTEFLKNAENRAGSPILLTGPSNTGKTSYVRYFAQSCGMRLHETNSSSDLADAIRFARDNHAVILCENEHPEIIPLHNEQAEIYRWAREHPLPIFMTHPSPYNHPEAVPTNKIHFHPLGPERILLAADRFLPYPIDPRVQHLSGLSITILKTYARHLEASIRSGQIETSSVKPEAMLTGLIGMLKGTKVTEEDLERDLTPVAMDLPFVQDHFVPEVRKKTGLKLTL